MNQSPDQIKQSLFALTTRGIKYDLDRIRKAADRIGNPHHSYPSFHVAGTNGKGSTCAFIESILREAGYSTGLFTSPHIHDFEERFRINGEIITEAEWVELYYRQKSVIEAHQLTFFEATMLMAIQLFASRKVDWAIFETGLGGRLDATNILTPRVTVITRIAMDHSDYLGDTLSTIAREKLGIVKRNVPLVYAEPAEDEIKKLFIETCRDKNVSGTSVSEQMTTDIIETGNMTSFTYGNGRYDTHLQGRFQVVNALLALEALNRSDVAISEKNRQTGIERTALQGRFQRLTVGVKTVIVDVGHNPDAAAALCKALRRQFPGKSICFITGIMHDKDYRAMVAEYVKIASYIILTRPETKRAALPEELAEPVPEEKRTIVRNVKQTVELALNRPEEVVCITGSFYTVGEALEELQTIVGVD